jgi:tRNA-modifying protein YgfZ
MSDRVIAEGSDARSFLQGQLSQDMAIVDRDGSAWSWLLQPTGKVAALVRVSPLAPESYALDVDGGFGTGVMARLNRFKLRVKVDLRLEESSGPVYPGSEAERIEAGWPAMGSELTVDETIPNAAGINDRTVSFTKGCYTGQELVARVDSRGDHTPQHLRCLALVNGALHVDEELLADDGKIVGRITSVHADQALGWVARSIEVGSHVRSASATVRVLR